MNAIKESKVELALIDNTDEDDPVVRFLHTRTDDPTYDVFVNGTWDEFGSAKWYQLRCSAGDDSSDPLTFHDCEPA